MVNKGISHFRAQIKVNRCHVQIIILKMICLLRSFSKLRKSHFYSQSKTNEKNHVLFNKRFIFVCVCVCGFFLG